MDMRRIEESAKRARYTVDPSDEELQDTTEKSMYTGLEDLGDYLEKAGQKVPTRDPKPEDITEHGEEDGDDEVEGKGKTSGSNTSGKSAKLVPAGKVHSMKTGDAKASDITTRGSEDGDGLERSMTPAAIRDLNAHERAQMVSRLKKGEDPLVIGEPEQFELPQPDRDLEKASPYSVGAIENSIDETAAKLAAGGEFYEGPAPEMSRPGSVLHKSMSCSSCGSVFPAMYTSCTNCGAGQVAHQPAPGSAMVGGGEHRLSKANYDPVLRRPKQEPDLYIPGPSEIPTKR